MTSIMQKHTARPAQVNHKKGKGALVCIRNWQHWLASRDKGCRVWERALGGFQSDCLLWGLGGSAQGDVSC